jgi:hypothetical protein
MFVLCRKFSHIHIPKEFCKVQILSSLIRVTFSCVTNNRALNNQNIICCWLDDIYTSKITVVELIIYICMLDFRPM